MQPNDFFVLGKYLIFILLALFTGLITRRAGDRVFKAYRSTEAMPKNNIGAFVDMVTLYVFTAFCSFVIGSPVISLADKLLSIDDKHSTKIELCIFLSIVIIVLAVLRLIRIIDDNYDNQDVMTWSVTAVPIIIFITLTKVEFINNKIEEIIPKTGFESRELEIGAFLVFIVSGIVIFLVELFGAKIKNPEHKFLE